MVYIFEANIRVIFHWTVSKRGDHWPRKISNNSFHMRIALHIFSWRTSWHTPIGQIIMMVADALVPNKRQVITMQPPCLLGCDLWCHTNHIVHYSDVIMRAMVYQIIGVPIVFSAVCSGTDQKHQAPRHWPLWGESIGDRWIPITTGQ